jgi:hypothetical protein
MITEIEIVRQPDQTVETKGLASVLDDSGASVFKFDTLELPNKDNSAQISCIPCGIYTCLKVPASHIPYEHIAVENVPNRSGICMHIGNYAAGSKVDFEGCIGCGQGYADLNGDGNLDLLNSKITFNKIMAMMPDTFKLTIK